MKRKRPEVWMGTNDEQALVNKLVSMDSTAWETLCREIAPMLLAFVQASFTCGREKAEEVVQRTLTRSVRSIHRYDSTRGRLVDWLKGICRNEAITLLKQDARHIRLSTIDGPARASLEQIDQAPIPPQVMARKEVRWLIHEILYGLRPNHRDVLTMKYLKGRKVSEIAEVMGQTEKAIESSLSRARQAFKNALLAQIQRSGDPSGEALL